MIFNEEYHDNPPSDEDELTLPLSDASSKEMEENADNVQKEIITNDTEARDGSDMTCEEAEESRGPQTSFQLRDRKKIRTPQRYEANLVEMTNPETYEEAISRKGSAMWIKAIRDELDAHRENQTWIMDVLPEGKTALGCRWVFKIKDSNSDEKLRYKARLCTKGSSQKPGIDYKEIFAPMVRYESIWTLLAIAVERKLETEQFDVKTAFLHGELSEEIYMEVPSGLK